ncbi:transporter substrate-binding domain-containing protein [Haliea sp. E1-2-M8]|uniref:transporter substrate-binding domain-containing protein n=1 Tax=Haliea sp. E1-2-M8 TaxID=3064706 RepID=UPI00271AA291|nr:transporter substrate-binding domain-containing protein [Haliea sp. E1-2-M8]MDO8861161.1 transporter substrate-binding domain-containing protein [Haliea sp. E1-2-M8]
MIRLLVLSFLLATVAAPALAQTLRVGLAPEQPPLVFRDGERIVGLEADNARAVAEVIGRRVELVPMAASELLPALEQGRIDVIMSGMSVTPERASRVQFVEPYLQAGQMAIMQINRVGRFGQPWAIYREDIRVGVVVGSSGEAFARRDLTDAAVRPFAGLPAAMDALRAGEIDLLLHDAVTSWLLATSDDYTDLISQNHLLTEEPLAWAVRRDDPALAAELARALSMMRSNGTLDYIIDRWIPVRPDAPAG